MVLTKHRGYQLAEWWAVFLISLVPLLFLFVGVIQNSLGPDPISVVLEQLGRWGMHFLWITLAITPARKLFKWNRLAKYRRMMGLYCLFYASLHLLVFLSLIVFWQWDLIIEELSERPYITIGFAAFCLLIPLGVTSLKVMVRKLGKHWLILHRSVYLIAGLVLLHFWWQLRSDVTEGVIFASILIFLLGFRVLKRRKKPNR